MYSKNILHSRLQQLLFELVGVFVAAMVAVWIRHGLGLFPDSGDRVPWGQYLLPALSAAGIFAVVLWYRSFHTPVQVRKRDSVEAVMISSVATVLTLAVTFFLRGETYSRLTVLFFYPLSIVAIILARQLHRRLISNRSLARRVLIVGYGTTGRRLGDALMSNPSYHYLAGYLDDRVENAESSHAGVGVLGGTRDLRKVVSETDIDEVFIAIPSVDETTLLDLIGECMVIGVTWRFVPTLSGMLLERAQIEIVDGLPLVGERGTRLVGVNWLVKRGFDLAVATAALVVAAPAMLLIAVLTKVTSHGPVIFRQERVGYRGQRFTLFKFRTMRADAKSDVHQQYTAEWIYGRTGSDGHDSPETGLGSNGSHHKMKRDARVTPFGRILRKTSLDELPQLWNVMRGDMSIVGPRPPIPYEVEHYTVWHNRRLEVPPGITGLWQVSGRNRLSFDEMVQLDIAYIENWSIGMDLHIVLKTIPSLVVNHGE